MGQKFPRMVILFLLSALACSCNHNDAILADTDRVIYLEFDGFKGNFHNKYDLIVEVTQKDYVAKIDSFLRNKKNDLYYGSPRPVEWTIAIYSSIESGKKGEFVCSLIHTVNEEDVLRFGRIIGQSLYVDSEFSYFLKELLKVDEIEKYQGPMDQQIYNEMILRID